MTFPIEVHREEIVDAIDNNRSIIIKSGTGSGKTLFIPSYIVKTFKGLKVRVAIPLTVAVNSAYAYVKKQKPDFTIGFSARREINYNFEDTLVYATTGHYTACIFGFLGKSPSREDLINYTRKLLGNIFIIDEVHMLNQDTSILLGLIKEIFRDEPKKCPRLIFMSATANIEEITRIFGDLPFYDFATEKLDIEQLYLPEEENFSWKKFKHNDEIVEIVKKEYNRSKDEGKIWHGIIFRPGISDILDTLYNLEALRLDIDIYPAHSSLSSEEIQSIFEETGRMKIVIGTNIIESSVTINDVGFVIDDCLTKFSSASSYNDAIRLEVGHTVKSESIQRQGRTGRTMPGRVYRLIPKSTWEELNDFRPREIDRIPIHKPVLMLMNVSLDATKILSVEKQRVDASIIFFHSLDLLTDGKTNKVGMFIANSPLAIENALMVYYATQEISKDDTLFYQNLLAMVAMIECYEQGYFYQRYKKWDESPSDYKKYSDELFEKHHKKYVGRTDLHTFNNLFNDIIEEMNHRYSFAENLKYYSRHNFINHRKIAEVFIIFKDISRFYGFEINDLRKLKAPADQIEKILPFFRKAYRNKLYLTDDDGNACNKLRVGHKYYRATKYNQLKKDYSYIYGACKNEIVFKDGRSRETISLLVDYPPILTLEDLWNASSLNPAYPQMFQFFVEKMTKEQLKEFVKGKEDGEIFYENFSCYCYDDDDDDEGEEKLIVDDICFDRELSNLEMAKFYSRTLKI